MHEEEYPEPHSHPQHHQTLALQGSIHRHIAQLSLEHTWFTFTPQFSSFSDCPSQGVQPSYPTHLGEEGPLLSLELEAVRQQAPHGLGTVAGDFTEVRRQITPAHHKDNLEGRGMADLGCEAQGIWGLEELGRFLLGDRYSGYWGTEHCGIL